MALVVMAALALVLALQAPGQARPGGHGFGGGPRGGAVHHGFDGHHGFHGHRGIGRGLHRGFALGPAFPYYPYYPYGYSPYYGYRVPAYLYYCGSVGAYYPSAQSCPEGWIPVPVT
jgi:hypothetical protein